MKSDNPNGFYEAETTRTLDANGGRPDCAGGMVVVCIGSGWRKSSVNVRGACSDPGYIPAANRLRCSEPA